VSRLWFTVGFGILNEIHYPRVDMKRVANYRLRRSRPARRRLRSFTSIRDMRCGQAAALPSVRPSLRPPARPGYRGRPPIARHAFWWPRAPLSSFFSGALSMFAWMGRHRRRHSGGCKS
jgi:hypothetical protein